MDYSTLSPKLSTWLAAVTRNLCIDAHRAAHGRRRFPAALLRMSDFAREVFRLYYWEGRSNDEVVNALAADPSSISEALNQIQAAIGEAPAQALPEFVRFDDNHLFNDAENLYDGSCDDVTEWLILLEERERVVVRLKFWEELSAAEIVEILDLHSEQQIYSIMHTAMKKLRAHASVHKRNSQDVRAIQSKKNEE